MTKYSFYLFFHTLKIYNCEIYIIITWNKVSFHRILYYFFQIKYIVKNFMTLILCWKNKRNLRFVLITIWIFVSESTDVCKIINQYFTYREYVFRPTHDDESTFYPACYFHFETMRNKSFHIETRNASMRGNFLAFPRKMHRADESEFQILLSYVAYMHLDVV